MLCACGTLKICSFFQMDGLCNVLISISVFEIHMQETILLVQYTLT